MYSVGDFPHVEGILRENAPLGKKSFFGVGGTAEILFIPKDMDDLVVFLRSMPDNIPVTVLGVMSNVLVRSGGIEGVVISLGDWFNKVFVEGNVLEVGASVHCGRLSSVALENEIGGFEFLTGIPGTVGGAVKMNAGCCGAEIFDILIECEGINFSGQIKWIKPESTAFGYRVSGIPDNLIITRAWFRGSGSVDYSVSKKVNEIIAQRRERQPLDKKSCGSAFKNPEGCKAWELIDAAGCRGMRVGGAMVSEKHCNFIINEDNATAEDIEDLGELVVQKVFENSGIRLEWEIIRLGKRR